MDPTESLHTQLKEMFPGCTVITSKQCQFTVYSSTHPGSDSAPEYTATVFQKELNDIWFQEQAGSVELLLELCRNRIQLHSVLRHLP